MLNVQIGQDQEQNKLSSKEVAQLAEIRLEEVTTEVHAERGTSVSNSRETLYNEGFEAGYNAAVDDYVAEKLDLDLFERKKTSEDLTDIYVIGFEMGYLRKLAEIAVN